MRWVSDAALKGRARCYTSPYAKITAESPKLPAVTIRPARIHLLIYALLSFQLLLKPIEIAPLNLRRRRNRQLHLFRRVVKLPLRAVHTRQSGVHEPLIRMLLGIVQKDRKR